MASRRIRFYKAGYDPFLEINGPPPDGVDLELVEHFNRPETPVGFTRTGAGLCDRPLWQWGLKLDLDEIEYGALEEFFRRTQHEDFFFRHTDGRVYECAWWMTDMNFVRTGPLEYAGSIEFLSWDEPDGTTAAPFTSVGPTSDEVSTPSPTTEGPFQTGATEAAGTTGAPTTPEGEDPFTTTPGPTSVPGSSTTTTVAPVTTTTLAPDTCSGGIEIDVSPYGGGALCETTSRWLLVWATPESPLGSVYYLNWTGGALGAWRSYVAGNHEIILRLTTENTAEVRVQNRATTNHVWQASATFVGCAGFNAGFTIDLGDSQGVDPVAGGTVELIPCSYTSTAPAGTTEPPVTTPMPSCCERARYYIDIVFPPTPAPTCPFCYYYSSFNVEDVGEGDPAENCRYFWRAPQVPGALAECYQTGTGGGSQRPYAELVQSGGYWYLHIKQYGGTVIVSYRRLIAGWDCSTQVYFDKVAGTGTSMCIWPAQASVSPHLV